MVIHDVREYVPSTNTKEQEIERMSYFSRNAVRMIPFLSMILLPFVVVGEHAQGTFDVRQTQKSVTIMTDGYVMNVQKQGFRFGFQRLDGGMITPPHPESGLQIAREGEDLAPVTNADLKEVTKNKIAYQIHTDTGIMATVEVQPMPHAVKITVRPEKDGEYSILVRTSGLTPSYGLAEHAAFGGGAWNKRQRRTVELTGFEMNPLHGPRDGHRMISNFVIFPRQGFAEVNIEPGDKLVRLKEDEKAQGSRQVRQIPAMYYFVGSPKEIYRAFLAVRNREGYPVYKPKYEWFGVGWEAFGALAWNTTQETVTQNVNKYLGLGYPLHWMVVGSGFWPRGKLEFDEHGSPYGAKAQTQEAKKLQATTSFGMWDERIYPDPKGMIEQFHQNGLKFTIGLRIGFIPGGPFTPQGLENSYFLKDKNQEAQLFDVGFPKPKVYLLDGYNPEAVGWYVSLCHKWMEYGVDGFKEDLFGWPQWLPDDLIDPVNRALMEQGVYIMGRNAYLGSPVDIHRYNDFNYDQPQDRGPINGLAFAYSGFPYVYPDIVGGTGLATGRFGEVPEDKLRVYLMRYAQYAAVHPSMSYGYGPWNYGEYANQVALDAAKLHARLHPYIYDAALDAYETGFPFTMTPLPLAYPEDSGVYGLSDSCRRSYQWLMGESLLATPLFGDDYATANSRDVYLPEGTWIDYDTGREYRGPVTLEDFALPVGKTPLFVGGKGIVVEQVDGQLMARVYRVTRQSSMVFTDKDGKTKSTIAIHKPDWNRVRVVETTTGNEAEWVWNRHACEFPITPGYNYCVK